MLKSLIAMFSAMAVGCATAGVDRPTSSTSSSSVPATERLYVVGLSLRNLDAIYVRENERLERLCPPPRPDNDMCLRRNVASSRERVVTLHSAPSARSRASAFVNAFPTIDPSDGTLRIGLDLETAVRPREFIPWIADVGDWGYSIHIDGDARPQGDWVQLLHPALSEAAWMPNEAPEPDAGLYVHVDSIAGHILQLQRLEATDASGSRVTIEPGDYLITRLSNGVVEFRLEVEWDFACGDEIPEPTVFPPLLRANPAEFFGADGRPRFSTKYTKGC